MVVHCAAVDAWAKLTPRVRVNDGEVGCDQRLAMKSKSKPFYDDGLIRNRTSMEGSPSFDFDGIGNHR